MFWKKGRVDGAGPAEGARPWSLATRLTLWYAASAFLLVLIATAFLYSVLAKMLDVDADESLADQVHILRVLLRERPGDIAALKQEVELEGEARTYDRTYVRLIDERGHSVIRTPGMRDHFEATKFPVFPLGETAPLHAKNVSSKKGASFRAVAARATVSLPGKPQWTLQVALDRTSTENILAGYRQSCWVVLALAFLICAFEGYRIARTGIRPIKEITATARRIRSTTMNERLCPASFPHELADLAGTFNEMLDRLGESFTRLGRFSADIAHELRTPLNNLRLMTEVALAKPRPAEEYSTVLTSCLEEYGRLGRLIDSVLFLARAEAPKNQVTKEDVNVRGELEIIRDFYEAAAAEAGVRLQVAAAAPIVAPLNRALFQQAVGNLVHNALTHTPRGGMVTLSARLNGATPVPADGSSGNTARNGAAAVLRIDVQDTGAGIPPEHLSHIFERFYRADPARSCAGERTGLGLAIVKSIAELHGGSVEVASAVGHGTQATLLFPLHK